MLGLPRSTEMNRPLSKKAIFDKFKPKTADRRRFDSEIRRLALVHEVSPATVNIASGKNVATFYVVLVSLREPECDTRNLTLLAKLIPQNMLFVLEHERMVQLAVFRAGRIVQSSWKLRNEWDITLAGLNLDAVWENTISQIGGVVVAEGRTLDEQLALDAEQDKLRRQIERLEKQAWNEKQPRQKWNLAERISSLKSKLKQ
jgi:hypothetical protein